MLVRTDPRPGRLVAGAFGRGRCAASRPPGSNGTGTYAKRGHRVRVAAGVVRPPIRRQRDAVPLANDGVAPSRTQPSFWRRGGRGRFWPRDLSADEDGAVDPSRPAPPHVHVQDGKQVFLVDGPSTDGSTICRCARLANFKTGSLVAVPPCFRGAAGTPPGDCWRSLVGKLWPRSLTGDLIRPDRQTLRDSARAAQLDPRQHIAVSLGRRTSEDPARNDPKAIPDDSHGAHAWPEWPEWPESRSR